MRDLVAQFLLWIGRITALGAAVSVVLAVWKLWKDRDEDYRQRYQEHLERKHRVDERLGKARKNGI